MLKTALVAIALFSLNTWACPNLEGNFVCKYEDGSTESLHITQTEQNGVTLYSFSGVEVASDGREYQMDESDDLKEGRYSGVCNGDVLNISMTGKLYDNNQPWGDLTIDMAMSIDANGAFSQHNVGQAVTVEHDTYPIDENYTCERQ